MAALLRALADPGSVDAIALRAMQTVARRARGDAEAAATRIADEPARVPLTPELAQPLIATVARLAHAELAIHALALSGQRSVDRQGGSDDFARHLHALGAALRVAMDRLAVALRTLRPREPIPALRPIQSALRDDPALRGTALVGITDRLVDATDTLDAALRDRLSERH